MTLRRLLHGAFVAAGAMAISHANAADLPSRTAPSIPFVPPAFTWTGFYVGMNAGAGFGMGQGSFADPTFGAVTRTGSDSDSVFVGGAQVGYNYQFTPGSGFVVGVEADIQGVAGGGRGTYAIGAVPYRSVGPSLDYLGTVRARVGYAFDRVLVYGTGGFAYGGGSRPAFAAIYPFTLPDTTRTGYAVGGGVEYAFTSAISAKVEGLYVNLGRTGANTTFFDPTTAAFYGPGRRDDGFGLVRAGINYRF